MKKMIFKKFVSYLSIFSILATNFYPLASLAPKVQAVEPAETNAQPLSYNEETGQLIITDSKFTADSFAYLLNYETKSGIARQAESIDGDQDDKLGVLLGSESSGHYAPDDVSHGLIKVYFEAQNKTYSYYFVIVDNEPTLLDVSSAATTEVYALELESSEQAWLDDPYTAGGISFGATASGKVYVRPLSNTEVPVGGQLNLGYNLVARDLSVLQLELSISYSDDSEDPRYLDEDKFSSLFYFRDGFWGDYQLDWPASTVTIDKDANVISASLWHLTPIVPVVSSAASEIVVNPSDMATDFATVLADPSKWFFYNDESDTIDNTLGSFVNGPSSPIYGDGSVQISVSGTQRRNLATYQFSGTYLSEITQLSFSTYNPSAGNGGSANRTAYLNFNVDFDGSDTWQRRLIFVPPSAEVAQDTWQDWDTIQDGSALWHYSGTTWPVTGESGSTRKTWSQILSDYPGVRVRVNDSWLGLRVGSPYADGYTENIDSFTIGTADDGVITFNFEPDTTPPAVPTDLKFRTLSGQEYMCGAYINSLQAVIPMWAENGESDFSHYEYTSFHPNGSIGLNEQVLSTNELYNTWAPPADGIYGFAVRAVDNSGNKSAWALSGKTLEGSCQVKYDSTAPVAPTLVAPANNSFVQGASLTNSWNLVDDADHYIYESYHNEEATNVRWTQQINAPSTSKTATNVADATFWWRVKAVDAAGNESPWSPLWRVTVDSTSPTEPNFISPRNNSYTNVNAITLNWEGGDDSGSGVLGYSFRYVFYPAAGGSPVNWGTSWINTTNKTRSGSFGHGQGVYEFYVKVKDVAGNVSAESAPLFVTYDATAPVVDILAPMDSLILGAVDIRGSVTDVNPWRYYAVVRNSAGTVVAGPGTVYDSTSFTDRLLFTWNTLLSPDGVYTIHLAARDKAQNRTSVSEDNVVVTVDNTKPSTPEITSPTPEQYFRTTPILNSWTTSTDSSGIKEYHVEYIYDDGHTFSGGPYRTVTTTSRNHVPALWEQGGVTIRVRAVDNAGNIGAWSDPIHYTYDATDPIVTLAENPEDGLITSAEDLVLSATTNEPVASCSLNFDDESSLPMSMVEGDSQTWDASGSELADGIYNYSVSCTDLAGNIGESASRTVVIDNTAPTVALTTSPTSPDGDNGWFKTQPEITLTTTDDNPDVTQYQWGSQAGAWTEYSAPFKPSSEGSYTLYYRAIDKAGNISEVKSQLIKWDKTDPSKSPQNISVSPNPTNQDKSTVKWDEAEDLMGIDHYEILWSHDGTTHSANVGPDIRSYEMDKLTEGVWNVTVRAYDGAGNTKSASVDLTVDKTAPSAPALVLGAVTTGQVSLSWAKVTGANSYSLWYGTESGNYLYAAIVGDVDSYTVTGLGAGDYFFAVKSHDSAGNVSGYSNEVESGTIAGTPGVEPGTPGTGFAPAEDILGDEDTLESSDGDNAPSEEELGQGEGDILGDTEDGDGLLGHLKKWWWLWILILLALYRGYRYYQSRKD